MVMSRDTTFDRVSVDHLLAAGTRVTWRLRSDFDAPGPYTFQLQIGESGLADADDWADIGDPADDVTYLLDPDGQRDFSVVPTTHYRVKLTTPFETHISAPVDCSGRLNRIDWIRARAIIRRELLRARVRAGAVGWLYKRRKRTELVADPAVVDMLTGEVMRTGGTAGVGTDRVGGYFVPAPLLLDMTQDSRYSRRDPERGQVDDVKQLARCCAFPQIDHGDVWADASSDTRYALHSLRTLASVRNVPIVVGVELHRLSPTDPIYELPLPEVPPLQTLGREEF